MAKGGKGRKGGGGGGGKTRKYSRDNKGRFASTGSGGATARGGRLATAKGNKRKTQTITAKGQKGVLAKPKGLKPGAIKPKATANKVVASPRRLSGDQKIARDVMTNKKLTSDRQRIAEMQRRGIKPGTDMVGLVAGVRAKQGGGTTARIKPAAKPAAAAKPATRKEQLAAGAKKRTAQADRIDAKIKKLESEYRGKDAAFYTQGAKPAGRDRMIAKSQKAAQLREESASLRTKAANAERMSSKIKDKPIKSSGGNKRLDRAIKNEAAGSTSYKRNPKGYQKRITALTAQKVYQTGDATTGLSVAQYAGKGFRLPRNQRAASAKPAAPKALTPAERIKIKTPIRRAMSTNRASVVTPGQRSRLETGKGAKTKGARLNSSVAKPRTAGNTKPQVASRVKRKLAAENAKMNQIQRRERIGARQGKQYERSLKREMLLERAKTFLESGKLPGKDNSIAAQRNTKQARQRLAAKNAERRSQAAKPAALKTKKARTDEGAFGDRYKRAGKVGLKRSIKESDNLNNPTGKATFEKRFAATQQRQSQADRTAAAAKDFYSRFGSPMSFAQRPKLSTAGGARFGVKKKPARKPRPMR